MHTKLLLSATLGAIAAMSSAVAEDTIPVRGMPVTPAGNIKVGDVATVHPKVAAGVGYDSNVYNSATNKKDDAFVLGLVGAVLQGSPSRNTEFGVDGELATQQYVDESERSDVVGRLGVYGTHATQKLQYNGNASWTRTNDPLVDTGFGRVLRDNYAAGASVANLGSRSIAELGVGWSRTDYLEATSKGNDEDTRDANTYSGLLRLGYAYARESQAYVKFGLARTIYDLNFGTGPNTTPYFNSTTMSVFVGGNHAVGTRTQVRAEAGLYRRTYEDDFALDANHDDRVVTVPAVNLGVIWAFETGSQASLSGFTSIEDGTSANASTTYGLSADLRLRLHDRLTGVAGSQLYASRDSGAFAGQDTEQRVTSDSRLGVEYQMMKGLSARLLGTYTDSTSRLNTSFERATITADAAYVF